MDAERLAKIRRHHEGGTFGPYSAEPEENWPLAAHVVIGDLLAEIDRNERIMGRLDPEWRMRYLLLSRQHPDLYPPENRDNRTAVGDEEGVMIPVPTEAELGAMIADTAEQLALACIDYRQQIDVLDERFVAARDVETVRALLAERERLINDLRQAERLLAAL